VLVQKLMTVHMLLVEDMLELMNAVFHSRLQLILTH